MLRGVGGSGLYESCGVVKVLMLIRGGAVVRVSPDVPIELRVGLRGHYSHRGSESSLNSRGMMWRCQWGDAKSASPWTLGAGFLHISTHMHISLFTSVAPFHLPLSLIYFIHSFYYLIYFIYFTYCSFLLSIYSYISYTVHLDC